MEMKCSRLEVSHDQPLPRHHACGGSAKNFINTGELHHRKKEKVCSRPTACVSTKITEYERIRRRYKRYSRSEKRLNASILQVSNCTSRW